MPDNTRNRTVLSRGLRITLCVVYFIVVNLMAGYLAVSLDYESLFTVNPRFAEYAVPLPFTWALAHLPSTLVFCVCLLFMPRWQARTLRYFRLAAVICFLLLFLELDEQIPFFLFWKIDTITVFLFSLILVPPNRRDNPILTSSVQFGAAVLILALLWQGYWIWTHRVPTLRKTSYAEGLFLLQNITVFEPYRNLEFHVLLQRQVPEAEVCLAVQDMAVALLRDYPFDTNFNKLVYLSYNSISRVGDEDQKVFPIGEISLNEADRDQSGKFPCAIYY